MAKTRRDKEKQEIRMGSAKQWADRQEQDSGRKALNLPSGTPLFQLKKAGTYRLEVVPYVIKEAGANPGAVDENGDPLEEGGLYFERTYYAHRSIGPDKETYACLKETFGKKCPICEHRGKLDPSDEDDRAIIKQLRPQKRQLWCVFDHSDADAGVKVWDISYFLFGEQLKEMLKNADEEDNYHLFAHPKKGSTLKLGVSEESFEKNTFYKVKTVEFKARKEPLDMELVEGAPCLDELIREVSYEDLRKAFLQVNGKDDDEEDEDRPPKKSGGAGKSSKKSSSTDSEDEDEEENEVPIKVGDEVTFEYKGKKRKGEVIKVDKKNETISVDCDDRDQPYTVDFDDESLETAEGDEDEEEEEEDEPAKKPKGKPAAKVGKKRAAKDDDEDDDDSDDEGDEDEEEDEESDDEDSGDDDSDEEDDEDDED